MFCGLEVGVNGLNFMVDLDDLEVCNKVIYEFCELGVECIWYIGDVFCMGMSVEDVFNFMNIDFWYLV